MKLFSPSEFSQKALQAFKRFPIALLWVILSTAILVWLINSNESLIFEEHLNVTLIAILGVSWLIGAQFYIEQFKKKGLWWIKIIIVLLLFFFYYTLPEYNKEVHNSNPEPYLRWTLFFITGHLALFFAPFITVWHPKAYWNYLSSMLMAIARSALFSGVLYIGIVLAMLAIRFLFEVEIDDKRYFQLFIICLGIVNTWVYLSDFPKDIQHSIYLSFHKMVEVFVTFILIPLAGLYMLILYAYALKILIDWELPKGWVSYLVTALAGLLFLIQFMIHPVRISHPSKLIRKFQPLAYWLFLPLLILLYIAIYKRVSDYGITEARYYLIIIALFITGSALYLIFSRKQQLRYLPISLAILAILSSFGFWGAFSVSKSSQLGEFNKVYSAFAKMEKNQKIPLEDYNRFRSITNYLTTRNTIEEVSAVVEYDINQAFENSNQYNLADDLILTLNLEVEKNNYRDHLSTYYRYESDGLVFTQGYDWSKTFFLNTYENQKPIVKGYSISLSPDQKQIIINNEKTIAFELSLVDLIATLNKYGNGTINDRALMQLAVNNDSLAVKINLNEIRLKKQSDTTSVKYLSGIVMLKIKE